MAKKDPDFDHACKAIKAMRDIRRPAKFMAWALALVAAVEDDTMLKKMTKASRDALVKLRAEIESP